MSEAIKHECGIAFIRLLKPLDFYVQKYGTALYGIKKLQLMMEKQHNRGQDGAGVATIKLNTEPGMRYISRYRSNDAAPLKDIFGHINNHFVEAQKENPKCLTDAAWLKTNVPYTGELLLGHLRYGTFGKNSIENCHPFLRQSNWRSRNLVVAGNFNLTNVDELFSQLVALGQHPKEMADTVTIMERIGHFLDGEATRQFIKVKDQFTSHEDITKHIEENLDIKKILSEAAHKWDGGYTMAGMIGHGDAFVTRDPWGIRPAFYYQDDEVVVVASERPVIMTAFNVPLETIKEIAPGHVLIVKKNGTVTHEHVRSPKDVSSCSFERIYFSRGSDADIYEERKELGRLMVDDILKSIDSDIDNSVFSFIPNTAEVAYYGMVKGVEDYQRKLQRETLLQERETLTNERINEILSPRFRIEKIAIKDAKMRTFITADDERDDMVAHVYDITYGTVRKGIDNLVVIDDSIVRGTTLKQSILKILDRLQPKKIIIASSAPQIRYPDCYGIDMAKIGDFIAFQAAIALLQDTNQQATIDNVYTKAKLELLKPKEEQTNVVKEIYASFTDEQISHKIAQLLTPTSVRAQVDIIYQRVSNLHKACPNHTGDWYFTGNYPTAGGIKVVNTAYVNWVEGKNIRAY
jgi:amidophosphoribosyltransferase